MTSRQVQLAEKQDNQVRSGMVVVREELEVPTHFPDAVQQAAVAAAQLEFGEGREDLTQIEFVTIDPAGSLDLDQAVWVGATEAGFLVHYAIADVAAFVPAGGAIDEEARSRGLTLYAPDGRVSLHPQVLSEGAASLLADQATPAVVWTIELNHRGEQQSVAVRRAMVKSRAQLSYEQVQDALDDGSADDLLLALRDVGRLRQQLERERGGIDLPTPQQIISHADGVWTLTFRAPLPVEGWNAQISLLTGMAAAELMLQAGVGVLRTMPAPDPQDLRRVKRTAEGLGMKWPANNSYPDLIRSADPSKAQHLAFLSLATTLLRGAGYTVFDGEEPQLDTHSAVAAPYAHVTAPLRRLVDRFGTEIALATAAGDPIPDWVTEALPQLPQLLADATRKARSLERESIRLVEAVLLADRVGDIFEAAVVDRDARGVFQIVVHEPAVRGKAKGNLTVGTEAEVTLTVADPPTRRVQFAAGEATEVVGDSAPV